MRTGYSPFKCLSLLFFLVVSLFAMPSAEASAHKLALSPAPRFIERGDAVFPLGAAVTVVAGRHGDSTAARALTAFLSDRGISFSMQEKLEPMETAIELRLYGESAFDGIAPKDLLRKSERRAQGYLLYAQRNAQGAGRIVVEGNDEAGLFYGVQTLKQLLQSGAVPELRIEDGPVIASRGVVEGFYGTPWTQAQRLKQLRFYGEQKLNLYIYAPKDDPYHREKWRVSYPAHEMARIKALLETARQNEVDFVFALSPGLDLRFDGTAGERDFAALRKKLEALYAMGVRHFAVYFDDIKDKSGAKQAEILNRLQREFVEAKGDVKPLLTVPTEYFTLDMADSKGEIKPYTKAFSDTLDRRVQVMYTGPGVVCEGIDNMDATFVSGIYGRKMAVWWNYPTTDYFTAQLALGPIYGLDGRLDQYMDMLAINPMEHAELSKIALETAAEYAWSPGSYQPEEAWERAIAMQYGPLADAMKVFADHSTRMDNKTWAQTGRKDAPALRKTMDGLWKNLRAQKNAATEIAALHAAFDQMERAARELQEKLPPEILAECEAQLVLFGRLANYDRAALQMVEAKLRGDEKAFAALYRQTQENRAALASNVAPNASRASISGAVAAAFLTEALEYVKAKEE